MEYPCQKWSVLKYYIDKASTVSIEGINQYHGSHGEAHGAISTFSKKEKLLRLMAVLINFVKII